MILDKQYKKCFLECYQLFERILVVKQKGKTFELAIIIVYATTAQSKEKYIEYFYIILDNTTAQGKSQEIIIITRELNIKIGRERAGYISENYGRGNRKERG